MPENFKISEKFTFKGVLALIFASMLALTITISALPCKGEKELYRGIIRFHVLANSDSDADQRLKLTVRDKTCAYTNEILENARSIDEARKIIEGSLQEIEGIARKAIYDEGYSYDATCKIGYEIYPRREYDDYVFPAGEYLSLRINIGSGKGKNWWCVLFPPLCTAGAVREVYKDPYNLLEAGFTDEQISLISEDTNLKREVRFLFLDLLNYIKKSE